MIRAMRVARWLVCALGLAMIVPSGRGRADDSALLWPKDLRREEVRCQAAGCVVGSCVTTRIQESPDWLWTNARLVPNFHDGQTQGVRLFAVRAGSLLAKLGIENGDTLLSIDGVKLTSIESLTQVQKQRQADASQRAQLRLEVLHQGEVRRRDVLMDAATARTDCPTLDESLRRSSSGLEATATADARVDAATQAILTDAQRQIQCSTKGCTIPRRLLLRILDQPQALAYGARVIPVLRSQQVVGWSVLMTKPDSLLERLGLRSGDTIVRIAERSLASPQKAAQMLARLRTLSSFSVELTRRESPLTLRYEVP